MDLQTGELDRVPGRLQPAVGEPLPDRGTAHRAGVQGDPWCIGTFLDNELEWYGALTRKGFLLTAKHAYSAIFWIVA